MENAQLLSLALTLTTSDLLWQLAHVCNERSEPRTSCFCDECAINDAIAASVSSHKPFRELPCGMVLPNSCVAGL